MMLNQKLQKTTMLWTQSTIQHPANNNYNVQLGVAKDQKNFGLQILFQEMQIFLRTLQHLITDP